MRNRNKNCWHKARWTFAVCGTAGLLMGVLVAVSLSEEKPFDLFPTGKPWLDVRIPRYDENDVLTSMMHTESLTRQDEKRLKLEGLTLVMFQASGEMTLRLKTKLGIYDVGASMLQTHSTTFIEHAQFEMSGNRLTFDTAKQQGTLVGDVEMRIYGVPIPAQAPAVPEPARAPEPAGGEKPRPEMPRVAPPAKVVQVAPSVYALSNPETLNRP